MPLPRLYTRPNATRPAASPLVIRGKANRVKSPTLKFEGGAPYEFLGAQRICTHVLLSSSVRYLGASCFILVTSFSCASFSSFGGGVVRVATGTPTSRKNFSCPAGEQRHSMRTTF